MLSEADLPEFVRFLIADGFADRSEPVRQEMLEVRGTLRSQA